MSKQLAFYVIDEETYLDLPESEWCLQVVYVQATSSQQAAIKYCEQEKGVNEYGKVWQGFVLVAGDPNMRGHAKFEVAGALVPEWWVPGYGGSDD